MGSVPSPRKLEHAMHKKNGTPWQNKKPNTEVLELSNNIRYRSTSCLSKRKSADTL